MWNEANKMFSSLLLTLSIQLYKWLNKTSEVGVLQSSQIFFNVFQLSTVPDSKSVSTQDRD